MDEQILSKYIHDLLDRIANENGFKNYAIQTKSGSQTGFTSGILSVTIAEKNSEKKLHLVFKQAPLSGIRRK